MSRGKGTYKPVSLSPTFSPHSSCLCHNEQHCLLKIWNNGFKLSLHWSRHQTSIFHSFTKIFRLPRKRWFAENATILEEEKPQLLLCFVVSVLTLPVSIDCSIYWEWRIFYTSLIQREMYPIQAGIQIFPQWIKLPSLTEQTLQKYIKFYKTEF